MVLLPVTICVISVRDSSSRRCMQSALVIEVWLTVSKALARSMLTMISSLPQLCASLMTVIIMDVLSKAPSVPDRNAF
ncbi:hypothetical protein T03_11584 [Trichinella britovi]|uniref:Uncharacterized protein n=1 Tax=Trichinella britovi TaxID=45882 RepID=A0A0V1AM75_TRIBR|nr:hypothetical protein T03_17162 [Trichinella britovi]KRY44653.1 hypothetical protein T03_11584 [Trichinella britovi]